MQITLIINASDPEDIERLRPQVERLRAAGHEVRPRLTFEEGDARRFARESCASGTELLLVAGGDGTVNEVANGLHGFLDAGAGEEEERGERVAPRVGIVPLGTGNDLAGALNLPTDPAEAIDVALNGEALHADVALVQNRCFLNVSTGGIGAEATEETSSEAKRAVGALAYLVTGVRKFAELRASRARFSADDPIYEGPYFLFAVGNSRRTGGGNWLTPRANPSDGLLDVCVVREMSRMEFLALLPLLRAGTHLDHPAVVYRQVPWVRVEAEGEISVNADGEPLTGRTFEYRISPHRLTLMVPGQTKGSC